MRFAPTTNSGFRADIGEMLNALHPIYAASKGTGTELQYRDLLENARRQLENVYAQIPSSDPNGIPAPYVQIQFESAQQAWEGAVSAPKNLGFTSEKDFGEIAVSSLSGIGDQIKAAVTTGSSVSKALKVIAITGVAIGVTVAIVLLTARK